MSKAVILQHAPYAGPGRILPLFRDFGIPTDVRRLDRGDAVPADLDGIRCLVVLGGPLRVADAGNDKYPFLSQEIETLRRMVADDRAVLGIGLGAQLLAHAAGAKVYPNTKPGGSPDVPGAPAPEFGWGPVTFPFPGGTEPMVMGMVDGAPMFHWHQDTFDLPRLPAPANPPPPSAPPPATGNSLLSSSKLCKNQAFRFRTRLFGFQYHMEFTQADIEALLSADGQVLGGGDALRQVREQTTQHYPRYARLGNKLLSNFVEFLKLS